MVRVNDKRHGLSVISTVTNKGQMRWSNFNGALSTTILIDFLRRLIKARLWKQFLILDNLRVHHAKPLKAWLTEPYDAIDVFYLASHQSFPMGRLATSPTRSIGTVVWAPCRRALQ